MKPNVQVGTCAASAATGTVVVTPDFRLDDKWAELRHLPLSLGFMGAWSMPINSVAGTSLGTFGTYFATAAPLPRKKGAALSIWLPRRHLCRPKPGRLPLDTSLK
ncbi:MAG: hypothetical protein P0120_00260 [Nitrospira sp.]|nr:hypothetical protein [Nitrospira sp.]